MIGHFRESQDFYNILYFSPSYHINPELNNKQIINIPKNLREYWKQNKQDWFSHKEINQWELVQHTYENDTNKNFQLILQYDQLNRHPYNKNKCNTQYDQYKNIQHRFATHLALQMINNSQYLELEPHEKIFVLLTLRHNNILNMKYLVLSKIKWELTQLKTISTSQSLWIRFLSATILDIDKYKRENTYFKKEQLTESNMTYLINARQYITNFNQIWDSIHHGFKTASYPIIQKFQEYILPFCQDILKYVGEKRKIAISISGGVDSMVLSNVMKGICNRNNIQMILLHIRYNNRQCCENETDLLRYWANLLDVPLYIRNIDELTRSRNTQYRTMYEDVTRRIRFGFYDYFKCPILLGHNKDDTYENIFSNLAKNIHFDNLKGMKYYTIESNIQIIRPFLSVDKKQIIEYAHAANIPFLEDSTPPWSRRGKTRDILMPQINTFDPHILPGLERFVEYTTFLHQQWEQTFHTWFRSQNIQYYYDNNNQFIHYVIIKREQFFNHNFIHIMFWTKIWFEMNLPTRPSNKSFRNIIDAINRNKKTKCSLNKLFNIMIHDDYIKIERISH